MNDQNGGLDNDLAAFTDRVLRGEAVAEDENLGDLGPVVKQLHHALTVEHRSDEEQVRARVRQKLAQEWMRQYPARPRRSAFWRLPHTFRLKAAAAVLLVVMVGLVLLVGDSEVGGGLQGTASGSGLDLLPLLLAVVGIVVAAYWFFRRRRG